MLTITRKAAELLGESRQSAGAPDSYGVRIFAEGPAQLAIAFVPEAQPGDEVTEQEGVTAFVARELPEALDEATLDVSPDDGVDELVLSR
jgi:Fe-S cluster assembly iron-binding protein IscA